mmetsp:Transcript_40683/g.117712  ORF Transcript_40683/g.117712 Transcript_40683/m.117712 type:complete len:241 (-) Transcript_40683:1422-2144(-)
MVEPELGREAATPTPTGPTAARTSNAISNCCWSGFSISLINSLASSMSSCNEPARRNSSARSFSDTSEAVASLSKIPAKRSSCGSGGNKADSRMASSGGGEGGSATQRPTPTSGTFMGAGATAATPAWAAATPSFDATGMTTRKANARPKINFAPCFRGRDAESATTCPLTKSLPPLPMCRTSTLTLPGATNSSHNRATMPKPRSRILFPKSEPTPTGSPWGRKYSNFPARQMSSEMLSK